MRFGVVAILALCLIRGASGLVSLDRASKLGLPLVNKLRALTPLQQDIAASTLSVGGTIVWLQIWIGLAKQGKIEPTLSRKIIHTGSAPLFMCLWPLFSSTPNAKYFAGGVVALQMTRLIVAGTLKQNLYQKSQQNQPEKSSGTKSLVASSSEELVNAISRSGSKSEALGGPLVYTIMLLVSTLLWFRESPAAAVAISQMAAGDGMADIIGRRWGRSKWPFAAKKSVEGSLAFVLSAFVVTCGLLALYHATGFLPSTDVSQKWPVVLGISILCAAIELLPVGEDNYTVPIAAAGLSLALL